MNLISALPALTGILPGAEIMPEAPTETAALADFGALLALSVAQAKPGEKVLATPGKALPRSGKNLPELPEAAPDEAKRGDVTTAEASTDTTPPIVPDLALAAPEAVPMPMPLPARSMDPSLPKSAPDAPTTHRQLQPTAGSTEPAPDTSGKAAEAITAAFARDVPRAERALVVPLERFHLAGAAPRVAPAPLPTLAIEPPQPPKAPPAALAEQRRSPVMPELAALLPNLPRAIAARIVDLPLEVAPQQDATITLLPALPGSATPSAPATTTAPPLPGHDFAALVDRLVEAREAAQPQAVHLTLPHADFGAVSLHFARDEAGLSVAMSSADPDFQRAAAAAIPEQRSAASGDNQSPGQPRSDAPSQRGQDGFAQQQRGGSPDRRPADEPRPATRTSAPAKSSDQADNGIFA